MNDMCVVINSGVIVPLAHFHRCHHQYRHYCIISNNNSLSMLMKCYLH